MTTLKNKSISKCKGCGADIVWLETIAGRKMPVDPERKTYVRITTIGAAVETGYVPHWGTCPEADKFKKGGKDVGS